MHSGIIVTYHKLYVNHYFRICVWITCRTENCESITDSGYPFNGHDMATRRTHSLEFKRSAVKASDEPGASTAGVAMAYAINANQLHAWRRLFLATPPMAAEPTRLIVDMNSSTLVVSSNRNSAMLATQDSPLPFPDRANAIPVPSAWASNHPSECGARTFSMPPGILDRAPPNVAQQPL